MKNKFKFRKLVYGTYVVLKHDYVFLDRTSNSDEKKQFISGAIRNGPI